MKLNLKEVSTIYEVLSKFKENTSLPFALKFKILNIYKILEEKYNFYSKEYTDIVFKYADLDENEQIVVNEGQIKIKDETAQECRDKIAELNNVEVDIDYTLTLDDLEQCNNFISMHDIEILYPLIESDTE